MQLKRIIHYFKEYQQFLQSPNAADRLYIWESQRIFQEEWNLQTDDLAGMYDRALQNSHTRRLWKRESYEPKTMMLAFIRRQPEFVRQMFLDLFDEEKSLEGRASRFVYYCDEMLQTFKKAHPHSVENTHFHDDDYWMVSLYLAFRFPERYTLYQFDSFRNLLWKLGVAQLPIANDLERFAKVSRTVYQLMQKETTLLDLHQRRLQSGNYYREASLLIVYDFYCFLQEPHPWRREYQE